jgi:DNA-binding response OmpR family regulator
MNSYQDSKTILIVEDQDSLRANLALLLELEGFRVLSAPDGIRGLELARSARPDLVLCDLMMPGLDGLGVVRILRADPSFDAMPFLFLTARGEPSDRESARRLGADGYLTKPVVRDDLIAEVTARLREGRANGSGKSDSPNPEPVESAPDRFRDSLSVLLTGTDILHRHGNALSEAERLAQREAMLAAVERLAAEMAEKNGADPVRC